VKGGSSQVGRGSSGAVWLDPKTCGEGQEVVFYICLRGLSPVVWISLGMLGTINTWL